MAAHQAPTFLGFSRQEHRSGVPLPLCSHHEARVISASISGYTIGQGGHKPDTPNSEASAKIPIVEFGKGITIYTANGTLYKCVASGVH